MMSKSILCALGATALLALAVPEARASVAIYYVGRDTGAGTNNGHLTFLRSHGDHFHRLGIFGGAEGRIPEGYIGGRLHLFGGTGSFANSFVSKPYHDSENPERAEYSDLEMRPISSLDGFPAGSPEAILLGGGLRYTGSLAGSNVALQLVSKTPGIHVADESGTPILANAGDTFSLGSGDAFAPFTPTFFTDPFAAVGSTYALTFRLVDLNGVVPESGTFRFELQAVPEPSTLSLVGLGGAVLALRWRHQRKARRPVAPTAC